MMPDENVDPHKGMKIKETATTWIYVSPSFYLNLFFKNIFVKAKIKTTCCEVYNIHRNKMHGDNDSKARRGETEILP